MKFWTQTKWMKFCAPIQTGMKSEKIRNGVSRVRSHRQRRTGRLLRERGTIACSQFEREHLSALTWPCQERRTRGENERASQGGGKAEIHTCSSGWQTREGSWFWPWRRLWQPAPWFLAGSVPSPSPVTSRPLCTISSFAVSMFICLHKMNQSSSWYNWYLALLESAKNFDKWRCYKTNPEEYFDALYFNRVICCYISTYLIKFQHQNSREITCVVHS